jgi:hypothetical protein
LGLLRASPGFTPSFGLSPSLDQHLFSLGLSISLSGSPSLTISPSLFSLYSDEGRKERGPKEEKREKDRVSSLSGSPLCLPQFLALPSPHDHLLLRDSDGKGKRKSKRKKREKRRKKEEQIRKKEQIDKEKETQ